MNPDQPYQLLPPLTGDEFAALKADIAENGVRVPVDVYEDGVVLDGHHRRRAAVELGIEYPTRVVAGLSDAGKRSHAVAVNVQRRILTREQRRTLIAEEIQRDPAQSDRAIARLLGCDHKTVSAVRRELGGEIPHHRLERLLTEQDYAPFVPHSLIGQLGYPLVDVEQFAEIAMSVKRSGLLVPIVLNHDRTVLIDGRIRYLACRAVHVEPTFYALPEKYDADPDLMLGYLISANFVRQSLTPDERAGLVAAFGAYQAAQEIPAPGPIGGDA